MYQSIYALNKADLIQTKFIGFTTKDNWNANQYKVTIKNNDKRFTIDYYMGLAHKEAPKLSDVLYSLIMDSDALNMDFNEWCDMLGYDVNSIKDLKTYKLCIKNGQKLHGLFTDEDITSFKELLQDYWLISFYNYALIKLDNKQETYTMSITRNYNGSITISDIIGNEYIKQTYYLYTIREAKRMFKEYLTTL